MGDENPFSSALQRSPLAQPERNFSNSSSLQHQNSCRITPPNRPNDNFNIASQRDDIIQQFLNRKAIEPVVNKSGHLKLWNTQYSCGFDLLKRLIFDDPVKRQRKASFRLALCRIGQAKISEDVANAAGD